MITEGAIYREFWDLDGDAIYEKNSPSDFEGTLRRVGDGFELRGLDGTVETYGANGLWLSSRDRDLNTTTATYTADGVLTRVDFPDRRAELFEYHPDGRLAGIVEVGVGGADTRRSARRAFPGSPRGRWRRHGGLSAGRLG